MTVYYMDGGKGVGGIDLDQYGHCATMPEAKAEIARLMEYKTGRKVRKIHLDDTLHLG